jgi:hypothetical protein
MFVADASLSSSRIYSFSKNRLFREFSSISPQKQLTQDSMLSKPFSDHLVEGFKTKGGKTFYCIRLGENNV